MKNLFLKASHWQIFIFIFGLPMVMQIVMTATMFSNLAGDEPEFQQSVLIGYGILLGIVTLAWMCVFLGWIWSVATGLQSHLPDGFRMRVSRFKIFFFVPLLYFILIAFFIFSLANRSVLAVVENSMALILVAILHLFAMFCIFYCMYFAAKTYKSVELQREVKFGDFVGDFFLVWFLFVGIWILQPKINDMIGKEFDFKDSLI